MRPIVFFFVLFLISGTLSAQYVYTIRADSVKLTNCDSSELIIENHTQGVPGFLYNTGNGRTQFKRGVVKINGGLYLIGADTLNLGANAWVQGGNTFGATGILGTLDNNHLDLYTNNVRRVRIDSIGNFNLDVVANQAVPDLFSLTNSNGTFKWVSFSGDSRHVSLDLRANNPAFGPGLQIMASYNSSIETFAYGELAIKAFGGLDLYGGYGGGAVKGIRFIPGYSGVSGLFSQAGNFILGDSVDNGNKLQVTGNSQVRGNGTWIGSQINGVHIQLGDSAINNALGIRVYGDTLSGQNDHYAAIGLNLGESASAYNMSKQGGGIYLDDRSNIQPIRFMIRSPGTSFNATAAGAITSGGNLLLGTATDNGSRLQVAGAAVINGTFTQGYNNIASFGNGLYFDIASYNAASASRIFSTGEIAYQSNYSGDQHVFENSIGTGFKGTLVTLDPGPYPALPDSQLTLKVLGRYNNLGLVVNMLGNTGIGTLYPSAQLHTTGTVRFAGLTSDTTKTRVLVSDANGNLYYRDASSLAANGLLNADLANGNAILPSLAVNGTVTAQRLKLSQTGWPDYVFAPGYHLPSLGELEQYIRQNSRLPGIPSAAEVEKKGIDVGDHQAALLKKIEELTLYTIEQDKKLAAQGEELDELKKEMVELKKMIIDRPLK
ncbi:MAG TPA: hypothetical protein VNS58_05155 [Puia sp.]|nr:hypothetical protein [Puia sp.]